MKYSNKELKADIDKNVKIGNKKIKEMAPSIVSISISIGNYLFYCLSRNHHLIQMILLFTSAHKYTVKTSVIIFDNSPFMTTPTWMNVFYNKLLLLGSKYSLNLINFFLINVSFSPQGDEATVFFNW